jgi:ADP-ribose pyrophosphatase YjhB (NUDIX family)
MGNDDPRADRRYPARPIVGVGGVILVGPDQRDCVGGDVTLPSPWAVVLVKRRFEPLAGQWSLPGGMLEVGETLAAGVAREILEETGLVVAVGEAIDVFDRITLDDTGRVRHHYVLIDYLCRPSAGPLRAGSDVSEVAVAAPGDLSRYDVAPLVEQVVAKALQQLVR